MFFLLNERGYTLTPIYLLGGKREGKEGRFEPRLLPLAVYLVGYKTVITVDPQGGRH